MELIDMRIHRNHTTADKPICSTCFKPWSCNVCKSCWLDRRVGACIYGGPFEYAKAEKKED